MRAAFRVFAVLAILMVCDGVWSQTGAAQRGGAGGMVAFDVVSIRQNVSGKGFALNYTPDGFAATGVPIQLVIANAYKLRDPALVIGGKLVPGAPAWVSSDKYDIRAKVSPADFAMLQKLPPDQRLDAIRLRMQSMLADRFKLVVGERAKPTSCYALIVGKRGPKIKPADAKLPDERMLARPGFVEAQSASMAQLAFALNAPLNCPVQDRTGLTGRYAFILEYSVDPAFSRYGSAPGDRTSENLSSDDSSRPSLFSAVREQLGLRLIPATVSTEELVIEHIERPSEN